MSCVSSCVHCNIYLTFFIWCYLIRILDYKSSANIHILQVDTIISPSKIGTVKFSTENKGKGFIDILTNDPYSPIYNLSIDVK